MATIPAYNPPVPFLAQIPGGLAPGKMLKIQGLMTSSYYSSDSDCECCGCFGSNQSSKYSDESNRFTINLQCGPCTDPLDDVALHIDVRPDEGCIVRNNHSKETGWGVEDRSGPGCPIQAGFGYEIHILAMENRFKIAINGIHYCEFMYRVPLQQIQYLYILNDTQLNFVGLEQDMSQHQQQLQPTIVQAPPIPAPIVAPVNTYIPPTNTYVPTANTYPPTANTYFPSSTDNNIVNPYPPTNTSQYEKPSPYNPGYQGESMPYNYNGSLAPYGQNQFPVVPPSTGVSTSTSYYPTQTSPPMSNTTYQTNYIVDHNVPEQKSKSSNVGTYAAVAGAAGLTGLAVGALLTHSSSSSSSSSSSPSHHSPSPELSVTVED